MSKTHTYKMLHMHKIPEEVGHGHADVLCISSQAISTSILGHSQLRWVK